MNEIQCRRGAGHFGSMQVAVHPQCRFLCSRAGCGVGDRDQPDLAPLITFADGVNFTQLGILCGIFVQQAGQVVIAVEAVESDVRHKNLLSAELYSPAGCARLCPKVIPGPFRRESPSTSPGQISRDPQRRQAGKIKNDEAQEG